MKILILNVDNNYHMKLVSKFERIFRQQDLELNNADRLIREIYNKNYELENQNIDLINLIIRRES